MAQTPNFFASGTLNRANHLRRDASWVAQKLESDNSRFIPLWRSKNYFTNGEASGPLVLQGSEVRKFFTISTEPIFLGLDNETPYFAVDLSHFEEPFEIDILRGRGFVDDLKQWGAVLSREEASLLAYARGMVYWHWRYSFCGTCGSKTASKEGGQYRQCKNPDCNAHYFSRTDPAIIVLVTSGKKCLLGRQEKWRQGVYSTLAGFVDPGESLEDAVAREMMEEAGITVKEIVYHSSQPWPFPCSLMIGFTAVATNEKISLNDNELQEARWFTRKEYKAGLDSGRVKLPSQASIARRLIEEWLCKKQ